MNNVPEMSDDYRHGLARAWSPQTYARVAGVLFLLTMAAGSFGEVIAPSKIIVPTDAGATARNITANNLLFRLGFASYLVEALCDVSLSLIFYALLRPVQRDLSLLAAFFGLVSTTLFAVAELFYFAALPILGAAEYLKAFSPDQLNTLALLSLRLYAIGAGIFMVFYGVAALLRGYLIFRSGYFPKALGLLLALGGCGFITKNFTLVLAPAYSSDFLLLPMMLAVMSMSAWLLVKGVRVTEQAAGPRGPN